MSLSISEIERKDIYKMYGMNPYILEDYITIDGRFLILNDNLFDLKEQKELGYIFNVNNLIYLFENFKFTDTPLITEIKEILKKDKISLSEIKLKLSAKTQELLTEQEAIPTEDDFQMTQSASGSDNKIFEGILKIARKIKSLLWTIGGLALDAFLVASGVGKSIQWIPWAIVLALDVYQWSSGNYGSDIEFKESSTFWKGLTIGFDALGLMTTGPFAKIAKSTLKPIQGIKSESKIAETVAKNPKIKGVLQQIYNILGGTTKKMETASGFLKKKMPKLGGWIGNSIKTINEFINWLIKTIGKILGMPGKIAQKTGEVIQGTKFATKDIGKGLKSATNVGLLAGGAQAAAGRIGRVRGNPDLIKQLEYAGDFIPGVDF